MGLRDLVRRREEPMPPAKTVVAAAVPLSGPNSVRLGRMRPTSGQEAWQTDAWYFYDSVGELSAPINRIALALSQAQPYAAVVDPDTGEEAGSTRSEDPRAQAAARMILGGAKARAQLLFLYCVAWQVCGEVYVIIRPQGAGKPDQWLALTGNKMTNRGGTWMYTDPVTGEEVTLRDGVDVMLKVYSPHPNDQAKANSAVRAALPVLAEIEKTSQNIAARLDSRVASNGLLFLPEEADYPEGYGEGLQGAGAWSAYLTSVMEAGLSNPGTAGSQVPIVSVLPSEIIQSILHIDLATAFDAAVQGLREADMSRLAAALDMPKATAEGTQADANHWSAWLLQEEEYSVYGRPLLERLGDVLTEYWLRPALIAMGVGEEEAERTIIAWDVSEIVQPPDRTEDVKWLWEKVLVSDEVALNAFGMTEDDMPDDEERARRVLLTIVQGAPTLLADPAVAGALNLGIEVAPAAAGVTAEVPGASNPPELEPPAPEPSGAQQRTMPDTQDEVPEGLTAAAELLVFDALSRAGGRLLTRETRGRFASTPKHELHTVIQAQNADLPRLLEGSFQFVAPVAEAYGMDPHIMRAKLQNYVNAVVVSGTLHDRDVMRRALRGAMR